jgi:hypothetical protein
MLEFVDLLTRQMHKQDKESLVIWYDSVIFPEGELKWQNQLNHLNKVSFFIFLCKFQRNFLTFVMEFFLIMGGSPKLFLPLHSSHNLVIMRFTRV